MCWVFGGLLQSIYFGMFCSKHSITFDTYLLGCRFHFADIFYINFRSCETFTVTNSGTILETPSNFKSFQRITERLRITKSRKIKQVPTVFNFHEWQYNTEYLQVLVVHRRFCQLQKNSPVIASLYVLQTKNKCTYHVPYLS